MGVDPWATPGAGRGPGVAIPRARRIVDEVAGWLLRVGLSILVCIRSAGTPPTPETAAPPKAYGSHTPARASEMEFWQLKDLLVILLSAAVVLIPIVGLTARFTLGPLIDKFAKGRSAQIDSVAGELGALRFEVDGLREDIRELETQIRRLQDTSKFDRQLKG